MDVESVLWSLWNHDNCALALLCFKLILFYDLGEIDTGEIMVFALWHAEKNKIRTVAA
jgi:hypothetical protein